MFETQLLSDQCLTCNHCTVICPVTTVSNSFPSPKLVSIPDEGGVLNKAALECLGCGLCSYACPHDVPVAQRNVLARAELLQGRKQMSLRDRLLTRPDLIGRMGNRFPRLLNLLLRDRLIRGVLALWLRIPEAAALPPFAGKTFQQRQRKPRRRRITTPRRGAGWSKTVFLFHGCGGNHFEPQLGEIAVKLLERLGCRVVVGSQRCCGLPQLTAGNLEGAREDAERLLDDLGSYGKHEVAIIGLSSACVRSLRHNYMEVLGIKSGTAGAVAENTWDLFEYLRWEIGMDALRPWLKGVDMGQVLYLPACQARSLGAGVPALEILRQIPGLEISLAQAQCCGGGGIMQMQAEYHALARSVGQRLFEEIEQIDVPVVACEADACRWWVHGQTGERTVHPVEILARSMGVIVSS